MVTKMVTLPDLSYHYNHHHHTEIIVCGHGSGTTDESWEVHQLASTTTNKGIELSFVPKGYSGDHHHCPHSSWTSSTSQLYIIHNIRTIPELVATFLAVTTAYGIWGKKNHRTWEPSYLIIYNNHDYQDQEHQNHLKNVTQALEKAHKNGTWLSPMSQIFLAIQSSRQSKTLDKSSFEQPPTWEVVEVYAVGPKLMVVPVTTISEEARVAVVGKVGRRQDLNGIQIRACSARDPTNWLERPPGFNNDGSSLSNTLQILEDGTSAVVFSELQYALNFTGSNLTRGDWISRHKNGTLKGVTVSLFRSRSIDIFIGLVSLLPYRATELSFLQPSYAEGISAFFIQPSASYLRDLLLNTFSFHFWAALAGIYLLILGTLIPLKSTLTHQHDLSIISQKVVWAIGTLCQQGWHQTPISTPFRIIFLVGYATGLLIYIAFSASIVSILSVQTLPISSRDALLSSSLPIYADNKSSTMAYVISDLKSTTKAKFGPPVSIIQGIDKLRTLKPLTYLAFPHYFYLIAENASLSQRWVCQYLSSIPVTLSPTPHAMVLYKNSPYYESFNYILIKRIERGQHHRFITLYNILTTTRCLRNIHGGGKPPPSISMEDLTSSHAILVFMGFITSFLILMVERCWLLRRPPLLQLAHASSDLSWVG